MSGGDAIPFALACDIDAWVDAEIEAGRDWPTPGKDREATDRLAAHLAALGYRRDKIIPPEPMSDLRQASVMIRTWIPECFPVDKNGQISFARAIMESVGDAIDRVAPPEPPRSASEKATE